MEEEDKKPFELEEWLRNQFPRPGEHYFPEHEDGES